MNTQGKFCFVILPALLVILSPGGVYSQSETVDHQETVLLGGDPVDFPGTRINLVFTGDNLLGSRMTRHINNQGLEYPYDQVRDYLRAGDITFGNLECPITQCALITRGKSWESIKEGMNFIFKAPPEHSVVLQDAGFDVMSLANNHTMDYRWAGLEETMRELENAGISYIGAGDSPEDAAEPLIMNCRGYRIGFLAYSMIVPGRSRATDKAGGINGHVRAFSEEMGDAIFLLDARCDLVVVSYHWGLEGHYYPAKYQKDIAHNAIDAGADIIVGHHPHRIQGVEMYGDGVIAYSLGNFMFTGKSKKSESLILNVGISNGRIGVAELIPILVIDGKPEPSMDDWLLERIGDICSPFETTFWVNGDRLVLGEEEEYYLQFTSSDEGEGLYF